MILRYMVCASTVLYAIARCFYGIANLLDFASGVAEFQLGNPAVPDQAFIFLVLVVFGWRRIAAVWAITVAVLATYSGVRRGDETALYLLGHAGDFANRLSR